MGNGRAPARRGDGLPRVRRLTRGAGPAAAQVVAAPSRTFQTAPAAAAVPVSPSATQSTAPAVPVRPQRATVAGYEILGELGRGGMGVVYKAVQVRLKRLVALKMILAGDHAGQDQIARFRSEAEAVAKLHHPNIVQIYEIADQNGQPYLSLEFVDGGSLAQKLDGTPQPARAAGRLVEVLARAMHYAHQRGIVHRDLKPANILLSSARGETASTDYGLPKITDFGLAKQEGETGQTRTGAVLGTPSYIAPSRPSPTPN